MARLFWVATGSVATIAVIVKGRAAVRRYAPATLVDRAAATAQSTGETLQDVAGSFLTDFRTARDERAKQLADALLAPTQGTVDDLRERREHAADRATAQRYAADVEDQDDEELGYSF
ncbi:hypothetical protein [Sanguibacter antarcticus]|uniref:Uncharacterized protein n=1 Tax=Sanguibacter antarcticus TaxID=372484 RepID=A0A2A9E4B8_9MICO|nr:hypothetical protein [Sanguibacter antarcticus]PFG33082.1 hypothetical protein ATL42_0942 [Sanguibacter antarcticus]